MISGSPGCSQGSKGKAPCLASQHVMICLSPSQTFTDSAHSSSNILSTPPNLCQVQPSLSLKSHNTKIVACSLLQEPKSLVKPYWPSNWHTTLSLGLSVSWSSRSLSALFSILSLSPRPGPSMRLSLHVFVTPMNCPLRLYTTVTHIHACMHSRKDARTHALTHARMHTRTHVYPPALAPYRPEFPVSHPHRRCCCWPFPQWPLQGCTECQRKYRIPGHSWWRWCTAWGCHSSRSHRLGAVAWVSAPAFRLHSAQWYLLLLHWSHRFFCIKKRINGE